VRLNQPASEFWRSTPKRVNALFRALADAERALDHRAGVIASAIVNAQRGKGSRTVQPADFFASLKRSARAPMTPDGMRSAVEQFFGLR
jgi:hypothetical protein